MKLYCPHCGVKGVADDSYRGKKVKCPKCNGAFVAGEDVAAGFQEAYEQPARVVTEEPRPVELRDEEGLAAEQGIPAEEGSLPDAIHPGEAAASEAEAAASEAVPSEETTPVEEVSAEEASPAGAEAGQEETAPETVEDFHAEVIEAVEEEEAIEAHPPSGIPLEEEKEPTVEERETVLEWDEISAEIEAKESAEGEEREKEFTAGPLTETAEEDHFQPAQGKTAGPEIAEPKEQIPDDHFIFEDRKREPEPESAPEAPAFAGPVEGALPREQEDATLDSDERPRFNIGRALREAWEKTKGAKGTIWAGSAVMYLTLIVLAAGGTFLLPGFGEEAAADVDFITEIANFAFQTLTDVLSVLFTAGLLFMGIRKVAGDPINWKMIFTGFSDAGRIIVATILQSLMIFLGFLVLVLPGIYLAVGYSMTLPLIVDRKMSPWQAMETSRKAVHKVWWRVVGLYLAMVLLFVVSLVPFGLGLIWTWPMFVILAGVVYRHLFRFEK